MPSPVKEVPLLTRIGLALGILLFRLLILTLRIRPTARAQAYIASRPQGTLLLLWHNRLGLALAGFSKIGQGIKFTGLVSASRDGGVLAYIMHSFGVATARGSSSRRAVEGTRELLSALGQHRNIVITPDGPRGPIYTVKEGAATLAQHHAHGVYLAGLTCSGLWTINSWDRFIIPHPFANVFVDVEKIDLQNITTGQLQEKLKELNP